MGSAECLTPITQTGAQNDQICTVQLKIVNSSAAAQIGGSASVLQGAIRH